MIQAVIVAAIVLFCLWQVAKRWLPAKTAVVVKPARDGGCGSGGCDTCGACKTLTFKNPE